ncbi:LemA family protein [uncultured Aquincola sp.]|uniref:LemA family protein n=1 Tax=uncultured Aquincola sp. TaxID=886556 RepID=UPI0032B260EC
MTSRELTLLAVGAILIFWMVGAYNRIVALRNRVVQAWAQVDEPLRRRKDLLAALMPVLAEAWPAEQGAVEAVNAAQLQLTLATDAMRAKPVLAAAAERLVQADRHLAAALVRVRALADQDAELKARDDVRDRLAELREVELRLAFGRQLFNDAVQACNEAAHQWPTRLLVKLYGFEDTGPL